MPAQFLQQSTPPDSEPGLTTLMVSSRPLEPAQDQGAAKLPQIFWLKRSRGAQEAAGVEPILPQPNRSLLPVVAHAAEPGPLCKLAKNIEAAPTAVAPEQPPVADESFTCTLVVQICQPVSHKSAALPLR